MLLAILCALLVTYIVERKPECPAVVAEKKEQIKTEDSKVSNIVTKTVKEVKKPDGTTVKTVTTAENNTKEKTKSADNKDVVSGSTPLSKYSLGLQYLPSLSELPNIRHTEIDVGARLGGSDFWLKSGFDFKYNQFKMGIEYQF